MADYNKLKKEYVKGGISYRQLSEKYGVPFGSLRKVAKKENWTGLRAQAVAKADIKLTDAVSNQNAEVGIEIYAVADLLLQKLREAVSVASLISPQAMRQYTAALRDLKDIKNIRSEADMKEQSARIDKLRKEAMVEKENNVVKVTIVGDLDAYSE